MTFKHAPGIFKWVGATFKYARDTFRSVGATFKYARGTFKYGEVPDSDERDAFLYGAETFLPEWKEKSPGKGSDPHEKEVTLHGIGTVSPVFRCGRYASPISTSCETMNAESQKNAASVKP